MGRKKAPEPEIDKCGRLEKTLQCEAHPTAGALQDHLYSGEYDPFRNAAIFESDFVQVTSKGEVLNIHNHVTVVTVGVTSTNPNYTLPNVMLLARPLNVSSNEFCTCKPVGKCSMELTRLFPLTFVRISIHDVYHRRLRLKLANGRSFYLQLYVHPDCENEIFERWMKLVGLLNDNPDEVYGYDDVSPEIEDILDNVSQASQATLSELSDWQLEPPEMSPGMKEYYEESLKSTDSKKNKKGKPKKKESKKKVSKKGSQKSVKSSGSKSGIKKASGSKISASKHSGSKKRLDTKDSRKIKSPPPQLSPSRHVTSDKEDQSHIQIRGRGKESAGGGDQAVSRGSAMQADSAGRGDSSYSTSPNMRASPSSSWVERMDSRTVVQQDKKDKEKGAKKPDAKSKEKLAKQAKAKKEVKSKEKIKTKDESRIRNEKLEQEKSLRELDKKKKEKEKEDKKMKEMEAKKIEKEKKQREKEKKDLEKKQKEKEKEKSNGKKKLNYKERKRLAEEKEKQEQKEKPKKPSNTAVPSNEKIDGKDMDEAVQELRYKVEKILEDEQD